MYVEFDQLTDSARLWVYPADRNLSDSECEEVVQKTTDFIESWTAHGANLQASCAVVFNRFLLIGLDENVAGATGCSIDASVHHIEELMRALNINFFDRSLHVNENGVVNSFALPSIKKAIESGEITHESTIFNTTIQQKNQLQNAWQIPITQSWANRYFKTTVRNN